MPFVSLWSLLPGQMHLHPVGKAAAPANCSDEGRRGVTVLGLELTCQRLS